MTSAVLHAVGYCLALLSRSLYPRGSQYKLLLSERSQYTFKSLPNLFVKMLKKALWKPTSDWPPVWCNCLLESFELGPSASCSPTALCYCLAVYWMFSSERCYVKQHQKLGWNSGRLIKLTNYVATLSQKEYKFVKQNFPIVNLCWMLLVLHFFQEVFNNSQNNFILEFARCYLVH